MFRIESPGDRRRPGKARETRAREKTRRLRIERDPVQERIEGSVQAWEQWT